MVRKLAELVDQQAAILCGAWGTTAQSKQLFAADYRRDGHHRDAAVDPELQALIPRGDAGHGGTARARPVLCRRPSRDAW